MSFCVQCGAIVAGNIALCGNHELSYEREWAECNRIMCDFLHRQKPIRRLARHERDDDRPQAPHCLDQHE